jgi:hypothetical protein
MLDLEKELKLKFWPNLCKPLNSTMPWHQKEEMEKKK